MWAQHRGRLRVGTRSCFHVVKCSNFSAQMPSPAKRIQPQFLAMFTSNHHHKQASKAHPINTVDEKKHS